MSGTIALVSDPEQVLPPDSVLVVVGTRPEAVKLRGVLALLGPAARLVHTGQHHDAALWRDVVAELGLPQADCTLGVAGGSRGAQLGAVVSALDAHLQARPARAVVVQGDTTAAAAGALAANARDTPLVHVEAGLRSFDRRMPEEHNRVLVDHLADLCCAPTQTSGPTCSPRGSPTSGWWSPATRWWRRCATSCPARTRCCGHQPVGEFVLATLHRPENVDDPAVLAGVLTALRRLDVEVLLPLHPRTRARLDAAGDLGLLAGLTVTSPLAPREFLGLASRARLLVSDSGGLQEEASVLGRPLVVVRRSTERPEVLGVFSRLVPARGGPRPRAGAGLDPGARLGGGAARGPLALRRRVRLGGHRRRAPRPAALKALLR